MAADEDDTANATADNRREVKTKGRYHKLYISMGNNIGDITFFFILNIS